VTETIQLRDPEAGPGRSKRYRIPQHIGIIPDGNRRWATARGLEKGDGYTFGIGPAFALYDRCRELGVQEVSVYGFTQENNKRPREQREAYQAACVEAVHRLEGLDAEFLIVGDHTSAMFPPALRPFVTRTRLGRGGIRVNLLINYSWRWDLGQLESTGSIGSRDVSDIELVVRWGGRTRLSGFLPVQCAYADICVLDELWPDYAPEHLERALEWYQEQDVTKGG
jgi:undecaprenyl diphosphate synthase